MILQESHAEIVEHDIVKLFVNSILVVILIYGCKAESTEQLIHSFVLLIICLLISFSKFL